ncbi:MAG: DsbA family protein [Acidimicrobiales bacterium]
MADVEFFFDPICPWAWITSRWVEEVQRQQPVDVEWRFIGLRILNEHRDYDRDFPDRYLEFHTMGLRLLRVAAALRAEKGPEVVGPYYDAVGAGIHVDRRREEFVDGSAVPGVLKELGHQESFADAAYDTDWDRVVRADGDEALRRTGKDVGTPILTFGAPDGPSFFGPVISRVPRGQEAVDLWNSVQTLARFPGFAELKRALREPPQLER